MLCYFNRQRSSQTVQNYYTTTTNAIILLLFWILSGTSRVSQYQKGKTRKVKPSCIYWSKRQWMIVASNSVKALKAQNSAENEYRYYRQVNFMTHRHDFNIHFPADHGLVGW